MDFEPSAKVLDLCAKLQRFMGDHVLPQEHAFPRKLERLVTRRTTPPVQQHPTTFLWH